MSWWTKINGVVTVHPLGRTQPEKRYILETVLAHLPKISGSEKDANIYIIQKNGCSGSSSCDEFMNDSNLGNSKYGFFDIQDEYLIVIDGNLRDRMFHDTLREFMKWICRLAKRVGVTDCLVKIDDYCDSTIISHNIAFERMWEDVSWSDIEGAENWCEYLMWDHVRDEEGHLIGGKPSVKNRKKS